MSVSTKSNSTSERTRPTTERAASHRWHPRAVTSSTRRLGVEATRRRRVGNAPDRYRVGGLAHGDAVLLVRAPRLGERARDDVVQLCVHLRLLPEVLLETLDPLEIGDNDTARVREDVGKDENAAVVEDPVGLERHRPVRPLADDGGVLALVLEHGSDVEPVWGVDAALRVGDGDHACAGLLREEREVPPDVSEPLDDDAAAVELVSALPEPLPDAVGGAARRGLLATEGPAELDRLPGDDAEDRVALVHRVRVEEPRHLARARPDVGRRDAGLGPDQVDDLGRIAARQPLELGQTERLRGYDDRALRTAEGQTHERALPRHPHRERLRLL